ncbi:MAG: ABC transporter permease [Candidatus Verstraetearchaeota archaeon]|jgi:ABC-2 type transport system permease protein|nr:ABC transporter permease [Candidatus Verstraetearchaeota archaeon]
MNLKTNEYHPSLIRGLWALTYRELKKWLNDPIMLIMFILQPLIWMGLLGKSLNIQGLFSSSNVNLPPEIKIPGYAIIYPPGITQVVLNGTWLSQIFTNIGMNIMQKTFGVTDYFSYMAIGMVSMIVVTATMFSGMSIVWDRRLGFLDKVLSTPVPRATIIFSKILNSAFRAIFQASVILALAYILGLQLSSTFTIINIIGIYAAIFLLSIGLSSIFLAVSIRATRMERPMQIVNLIVMPLMFSSNIFFPISMMPEWLQPIASANPLTYLTDAIRQLTILPLDISALIIDFIYLSVFAIVLSIIGIVLSWKYLVK